jgi:hypothetical protein
MYGAIGRGNEKYIAGTIAHRVLERVGPTLGLLWSKKASREEILGAWSDTANAVYGDAESRAQARGLSSEKYIAGAQDALSGIALVLSNYFAEQPMPIKVITEITITNTLTRHEGRIDALLVFGDHVETVDWKTNVTGAISQYERIQIVANGMLVNYRYGRPEDDFSNNKLTIFTPEGLHRAIPTPKALDSVRSARKYILDSLDGLKPHTELPPIFVCNECSYYDPCRFYMYDHTPDNVKALLWGRRHRVLKKRERSHLNKYLAASLSPSVLEEMGIMQWGYTLEGQDDRYLTLRKVSPEQRLFTGDSVRVIGLEDGAPPLACVSCNGSVKDVSGNTLKVTVYRGKPTDLVGLPIAILRADVDLSRRELESIDRVHRQPGPFQDMALALIGEDA